MPDAVPALLVGALLAQFPIAVWVALDARHRNLRNPEMYWLGIVVPAAGFVVILYYFSARERLPTLDPEP
ncbi:hypothetical protein [Haloplanus salilacus]|uniref:hypothetical protein n=1 Tax=Haloplanus salilacus TaxID=2949994 RepID=UPI0030D00B75